MVVKSHRYSKPEGSQVRNRRRSKPSDDGLIPRIGEHIVSIFGALTNSNGVRIDP